MKSLERRLERLEARVMTREDYIAFAVSEGHGEAETRAAFKRGDAWRRAHPSASITDEAEAIAARIGVTVDALLRTAEGLHDRVIAHKRARL